MNKKYLQALWNTVGGKTDKISIAEQLLYVTEPTNYKAGQMDDKCNMERVQRRVIKRITVDKSPKIS